MKYVYVLTSSKEDYYYEQCLLSLASLRIYNPNTEVIVLIDKTTKQNLEGKRTEYEKLASEIKVIDVPGEYSQKEASRWIKTSIHNYISESFLYIDCDTIVTQSLEHIFPESIQIGAVLDTHVTLEKHHKRDDFQKEDKDAGFDSSIKTNMRYNGGLIYCRGDSTSSDFFEKWHSLWKDGWKRGCSQDMPSLNQANYEIGNIITELSGEWNCQISHNGLPFLHNAKIIHYYATSLLNLASPYKLASAENLSIIKTSGTISPEIDQLLHNPLAAFEKDTRIISGNYILEIFDSQLFKLLLWLRDCHYTIFVKLNSLLKLFINRMKNTSGYNKRELRNTK